MNSDNLIAIASGVITVLTAAILVKNVIWPAFCSVRESFKTLNQFLIDWSGEDARPGRDAIPGVMERLNNIDGSLKNNGGGSLKDAIDRIEDKVHKIDNRLEEGDKLFAELQEEIEILKTRHY